MAERWQQWMPHDIDAWQGSANIQALSDLAYRAVHNLIQDMWKQDDCALPNDPKELAKRSRVAARWGECAEEVEGYFCDRTEGGRITHRVLVKHWNKAREVYEKRQAAAKRTNEIRSAHGDRDDSVTLKQRSADTGTQTRTSTRTGTKKKVTPPVTSVPAFRLPEWISDAAWQGFEDNRKRLRCPLTDRARQQTVSDLEALQRLGHPPDAVLDQSTQRGWRGVFELKGHGNGSTSQNRSGSRGVQRVDDQLRELQLAGVDLTHGPHEARPGQVRASPGGSDERPATGVVLEGSH